MATNTRLENNAMEIDARGMTYHDLNSALKGAAAGGATHIVVRNVNGQRYIGTNLN